MHPERLALPRSLSPRQTRHRFDPAVIVDEAAGALDEWYVATGETVRPSAGPETIEQVLAGSAQP